MNTILTSNSQAAKWSVVEYARTIVSDIQPTGVAHLGNYLDAIIKSLRDPNKKMSKSDPDNRTVTDTLDQLLEKVKNMIYILHRPLHTIPSNDLEWQIGWLFNHRWATDDPFTALCRYEGNIHGESYLISNLFMR